MCHGNIQRALDFNGKAPNRKWGRDRTDRRRGSERRFRLKSKGAPVKCLYLTRIASPRADQVSKFHEGLTEVALAGLRLEIGYHLLIKKLPGVGLAATQVFGCFDGLHFDELKKYRKRIGDPGRRFRLVLWLVKALDCGGKLANRRCCLITAGPFFQPRSSSFATHQEP